MSIQPGLERVQTTVLEERPPEGNGDSRFFNSREFTVEGIADALKKSQYFRVEKESPFPRVIQDIKALIHANPYLMQNPAMREISDKKIDISLEQIKESGYEVTFQGKIIIRKRSLSNHETPSQILAANLPEDERGFQEPGELPEQPVVHGRQKSLLSAPKIGQMDQADMKFLEPGEVPEDLEFGRFDPKDRQKEQPQIGEKSVKPEKEEEQQEGPRFAVRKWCCAIL